MRETCTYRSYGVKVYLLLKIWTGKCNIDNVDTQLVPGNWNWRKVDPKVWEVNLKGITVTCGVVVGGTCVWFPVCFQKWSLHFFEFFKPLPGSRTRDCEWQQCPTTDQPNQILHFQELPSSKILFKLFYTLQHCKFIHVSDLISLGLSRISFIANNPLTNRF